MSVRLVIARLVEVGRSAWIVMVPLLAVAIATTGWVHVALIWLLAYVAYTRVVRILFDWWTVRYIADAHGCFIRTGLVAVIGRRFDWSQVSAVTSSDDLPLRIARCREVRLSVSAAFVGEVVLPGVRPSEARRIERLATRRQGFVALTAPGTAEEPCVAVTPPLRWRDHLIAGIDSGRVILIVPFFFGSWVQISRAFGWDRSPDAIAAWTSTLSPPATAGALLSVLVVAIAYGAALSWVRNRGQVTEISGATIHLRAGLVRRERRAMPLRSIVAVVRTQSIVLAAFGRTRMRCLVAGSAGAVTRGEPLPLLVTADATSLTSSLAVRDEPRSVVAPRHIRWVVIAPVLLASAALVMHAWIVAVCCTAGIVVAAVGWTFLDRCRGRLSLGVGPEGAWVIVQRGRVAVAHWTVSAACVDVVSYGRARFGRIGTTWLTLSVRATRSHRLRVFGVGPRDLAKLRRVLNENQRVDVEQWQLVRR